MRRSPSHPRSHRSPRGFTLVEILIVVVILGILAAIVIPQFTKASQDAASTATYSELMKIRRHIAYYQARNSSKLPDVAAGDGTWGQIVGITSEYLQSAPVNSWVGGNAAKTIVFGDAADTAFEHAYGWIYNPATGDVYAGSFDAADHPIPQAP